MKPQVVVALLAAALLLGGSTATAGNPWNLRCPSMPAERPAPAPLQRAALRFFPWVRPAAKALRSGPVYLVALSSRAAISRDGDSTDSSGYYLHRVLIAVAPGYRARLSLTGRRLGTSTHRAALGFSTDGATACTVDPPDVSCGSRPLRFAGALTIEPRSGWRIVQTELRIGRTGCFALTASGRGLHAVIPLAVPGPDYGTTGW
ncbi:MAG TPA: hypothetical protein VJ986_08720 [Gaiellaceae bacterium]|nr:hypothetical protein [Gaiellaceae bacterium]